MRLLTDLELSLIVGGTTSSEMPGATVYGYLLDYDSADSSWYSYEIGGGGGDPGATPEPLATPCVETTLANGVSTTDANRAALAASNAIAALNDETYEYSSIVWALNGEVGYTSPYTDRLTGEVNLLGGLAGVPAGATIIGIVHNHPDDPVINDRIPSGAGSESGDDWTRYDQIVNWNDSHAGTIDDLPRGIIVDPNMLFYIYSNEDEKTHVYDKTDKSQTTASCSLQ